LPDDQIDPRFRADLEVMLTRFSSRIDLVEGFRRPYEASTIAELRRILLRLYSVAVSQHCPTPIIRALRDLVRPEVVRSVLEYYLAHFGRENTKSAGKYAHYLYVVAKYWVKLAKRDLKVLHRYRTNLKPQHLGMTEKNRRTLRLFEDEARVERLLFQSDKALAVFNRSLQPRRRDALALQSAVAIAILIAAPVRSHNLASIHIGRHLIWGRNGSRETCHLVFPANEVKNDIDLEFKLPPWVIEILKVYLAKARPLLAPPGNEHLFPGDGTHHKGPSFLSKQIAKAVKRVVGVWVTSHQFRHVVGFLYLAENPGGYEVVRRFLGHKRIETTIAAYVGMEQATAVAYYDRHLEGRRQRYLRARVKDRQLSHHSHRDQAPVRAAK
jgi:integrase